MFSWRTLIIALLALCGPIGPSWAVDCIGDCNADGEVTIDELLLAVNIAQGTGSLDDCRRIDTNADGEVTVEELLAAVATSLTGCPMAPLAVDRSQLCFAGMVNDPLEDETITVQSAQGTWTAEVDQPWIELVPTSGRAPAAIQVKIHNDQIPDGSYAAQIRVHDTSGGDPVLVNVGLSVSIAGRTVGWKVQTIEPASDAKTDDTVSLALDPGGRPGAVAMRDDAAFPKRLRFTHWNGCSWQAETITTWGLFPSLKFDSGGEPHVSFLFLTTKSLRYASRASGTWDIVTVENQGTGNTGHWSSLALDKQDRPRISYLQKFVDMNPELIYDLRYAEFDGTQWILSTAASEKLSGWSSNLALDPVTEEPHIVYNQDPTQNFNYAVRNGSEWSIETIDRGGRASKLRFDSSGHPMVGYHGLREFGGFVKFAFRDDAGWHIEQLESQGQRGVTAVSMALDTNGTPHLAYVDYANGLLKYATRTAPNTWTIHEIDQIDRDPTNGTSFGSSCALEIDAQNVAHIAYVDLNRRVLKYAQGPATE